MDSTTWHEAADLCAEVEGRGWALKPTEQHADPSPSADQRGRQQVTA